MNMDTLFTIVYLFFFLGCCFDSWCSFFWYHHGAFYNDVKLVSVSFFRW